MPPSGTAASAKIWHLLPHDPAAIQRLSRATGFSPIVAQLLLNRGVTRPDEARRFLEAPLTSLHEPELLPGMPEAVDRLVSAIRHGRRICIYGDYDVDGVTGTAILFTCLTHLGAQVEYHVPHRLEEGYGLNSKTLGELAARGVQVVVTVDCGIASVAEAEEARRLGLELIITDHHEPKNALPQAAALIHPRLGRGGTLPAAPGGGANGTHAEDLEAASYPFPGLCGSGVAFKLAWALCKKHCGGTKVTPQLRDFLLDAVVLAALGTVADVVPLFDENRVFVRHGLARLRSHPTRGLNALLRAAKLEGKSRLFAGDIGFSLAPRINAAGRLGTAKLAVELFTTPCEQRAHVLAEYLEVQNQNRQAIERGVLQEARALAQEFAEQPAFVLASSEWHPGILGIVASRMVDEFARPVIMIALRGDQPHAQGSGRSVPGFKLHEALQECTAHLLSHGGHATAAGLRILPDRITPFRESFVGVVERKLGATPRPHQLILDAEVPLSSLTYSVVESIQKLEPYGAGNPPPLFLASGLQVVGQPRRLGGGERHLSFRVKHGGTTMRAIAFNLGDRLEELMSAEGRCSIAFTPRIGEWQDCRMVEIEVRDFQAGPDARLG